MLLQAVADFWAVLGEMAPYVLFGFLMAGALSVLLPPAVVDRHLGQKRFGSILKATILGIPLPLCSCSAIPVAASLRKHGASRGATTAFLISAPMTGADSVLVTLGLLGPVFAFFRPLVALVSGVLGGGLISLTESSRPGASRPRVNCTNQCCVRRGSEGAFRSAVRYGFGTLAGEIARPLLAGLVAAGAISAAVPDDYFSQVLGGGVGAMLVMMVVGLPVYVCATASVPVAAALIAKGASPGAALVFLMTGPATNAATIATMSRILGKRTGLVYLGTVALTALGAGLLLDHIYALADAPPLPDTLWGLPRAVKAAAAVALVGVLGAALVSRRRSSGEAALTEEKCCSAGASGSAAFPHRISAGSAEPGVGVEGLSGGMASSWQRDTRS